MTKGLLSMLLLAMTIAPSQAAAATLAAGYQATDWATGFVGLDSPDGVVGPFGIAQSPSNEIYVSNISENALYHFSTSGGVADASTSASFEPQYGSVKGRTQRRAMSAEAGQGFVTRHKGQQAYKWDTPYDGPGPFTLGMNIRYTSGPHMVVGQ